MNTNNVIALRRLFALLCCCCVAWAASAAELPRVAPLKTVGVLGNSAGMSNTPVPYAFYTGIGLDARGRLYLAGAADGIPVLTQDGGCLAVLPVPQLEGMTVRSLITRAGDALFFVASNPWQQKSALYAIDTRDADAGKLKVSRLLAGPGIWAISSTLDTAGRLLIGQSLVTAKQYQVVAVDALNARAVPLFTLDMPQGATQPWIHVITAEADDSVSIIHNGGVNWNGRYSTAGVKLGEARAGQLLDGLRYHFGYEGGLRRMDATDTKPMPGECGSGVAEIRMGAQMVVAGARYFLAGRGGIVEAEWAGTHFQYTRRIGGIYLEDLVDNGNALDGIAYTAQGGNDVQHPLAFAKTQPIGGLLDVSSPLHGKNVLALVPAPEGNVLVYHGGKGLMAGYAGSARHLDFEVALTGVQAVGQLAVQGNDLLLADPKSGVLWRRPLLDKTAPVTAWKTDLPGVTGLAVTADGLYLATATTVTRLTPDGQKVLWVADTAYQGIRRLAATRDYLYVCDTQGNIVDQLDAGNGALLARLGVPGEPGAALDHLNHPYAIAADINGVYIADNGNGRVCIATAGLWQPDIRALPRDTHGPVVAVTIPVQPPSAGRMSVNIYDQHDVTVRQLVCAQPSDTPVRWDGRDMYGQWAAPGTYRYHGIIAPKFALKYLGSIGQSGNPPYRTADGTGSWGGVWGYVMAICPVSADPHGDIVVLWSYEEGEGGLIRMSQDGQVRWKAHLDWWMKATQMAVACDGTDVYVACSSAMGAPSGEKNYGGELNRPMIWRVDAASGRKKLYAPSTQPQPMFGDYRPGDGIVTGLLVHDGKLYLTSPAENALFIADAATGKQVGKVDIPHVSGVALDAAGRLLVGSGARIVIADPQGLQPLQPFADAGGPIWGLAAVPGGGVAATVGLPRQQVVYFNAVGQETRALGKAGGRPQCGKMQPENFRDPVGLCILGNGTLFVAESAAPKRFTRWSAEGKLEQAFQGPYYYSGMFAVDDENPEYVYGDTHGDLIRYKIDYATGAWTVDAYWIGFYRDSGVPAKWWGRIRHKDGHTYWCSGSGAIVELCEDHVRGVAAVYSGWVEKQADGNYAWVEWKKKTGLKGTWSDLNGDGKPQPEEWQVTDKPAYPLAAGGPQQGWGAYFDEHFDLYMHDWSDDATGGVWKLPVEWKNGVPVYRWEQAVHVGLSRADGKNGLAHGASGARSAYAADGAVYAFNGGYNALGLPGVGHGHDWEFAQITQYDPATGKPRWHAGERAAAFAAPGQQYCPTGAAGIINGYLFWTDENSLVHAWDVAHGLYVDTLLEDISRDPAPSPYTVWVELFNTRIFRHPQTGKVYLLAASDAIHVYEVLGTDKTPVRFQGEFTLTAEEIAAAKQQEAARVVAGTRTLAIPRAKTPLVIDGNLAPFAAAPAATLAMKPTAQGTVRLLYDEQYLYVGVDVADDSPWKNAGGDVTAMFKTGDEVSLWAGAAPGKRPLAVNDTRILFAPTGKDTLVMAYRPKVTAGARPVVFRSPSGAVSFDQVAPLTDVPVAVVVTAAGYRLEAAIPWHDLGLTPAGRFGLDLSVNFSDPAGQRNVARLHWGRNGAANVYDLPTEARMEPETWGWGELQP